MTDRRKLTDRDAIRRLALAVSGHISRERNDRTILEELQYLLDDLSEPAAPTLTGIHKVDASGVTFSTAPTVTREQAHAAYEALAIGLSVLKDRAPNGHDKFFDNLLDELLRHKPAFFRAVADALARSR